MAILVTLALLLTLTDLAVSSSVTGPKPAILDWNHIKHVIAFGDSYTYVQGTHGRQNYSFIGDNQNFAFTPQQLLSDRIVQNQTGTSAGGPNWLEYLTQCGLKPGLTSPRDCQTQLWDFAFAGADITEELLPLHHNFSVQLDKQVEQFKIYANPVLEKRPVKINKEKTVVAVWIGINDINDSAKMVVDFAEFYDQLMKHLFTAMKQVSSLGYKKFLFMNLPPLDRTPANLVRTGGALPSKTMVDQYNTALSKHASSFAKKHSGTWSGVFDVNSYLNTVLDSAEGYGIKNVTGYCAAYNQPDIDADPGKYGCLPLKEYFWYNSGHVTSRVHEILAGQLEKWLRRQ
ncbi:Putative GDSL lipase/esterase, SGNH hydrolase superfamily [Septoria linicola]|uniref:GDSL lipase/esterase, SGNH hydrolase superfamily n=1 Tax=Septoria linicola TaxID=215465 RepID=A0A9Q9AS97_9PEZI|nr:putative GDSL lipase/esterase, SGNH hydrolase superfamily [Septoria linicola]USW52268.1 Putative GDSL lipase/esterase, SGNH hydrolase superfamily [Septoria linicola]